MTPHQRAAQRLELQRLVNAAVALDRSNPHAYGAVVVGPFNVGEILDITGRVIPFPKIPSRDGWPAGHSQDAWKTDLYPRHGGVVMLTGEPADLEAFGLFARDVVDAGVELPGDDDRPWANFHPVELPYVLVDRLVRLAKEQRPELPLKVTTAPYDPEHLWVRRCLNATVRMGNADMELACRLEALDARRNEEGFGGLAEGLTLDRGLFFGMSKLLTQALAKLDVMAVPGAESAIVSGPSADARPSRKGQPRNQGKGAKCKAAYIEACEKGETPPTPTELAQLFGCSVPVACRAIKPLEDRRKAMAKEDAQDRRRRRV